MDRAGYWGHIAANGFQQRRLATAGRAEQHEAVGFPHIETDILGGGNQQIGRFVTQRNAINGKKRRFFGAGARRTAAAVACIMIVTPYSLSDLY